MHYDFLQKKVSIYYILLTLSILNCEEGKNTSPKLAKAVAQDSVAVRDSSQIEYVYNVQIAALSDSNKARELVVTLGKSNLPAYFKSADDVKSQTLYRIFSGPFYDDTTAAKILKRIKDLGYSEAFVKKTTHSTRPMPVDSTKSEVMKSNIDRKQLTSTGGCSHPQWSPSGREIAFFKQEKKYSGIYSIGTGGGRISKIIESNASRHISPKLSWSPQGDRLVFAAEELNAKFEKVENLYLINKDGSKLQPLIYQESFPFKISDLKWAPDGKRLAVNANYGRVDSQSDLVQDVLVVSFDKLKERSDSEISQQTGHITNPSFSYNTNWVVGWKSNDILLFLTTAEENSATDFTYEVWSYDFSTRERRVVLKGPAVKNCLALAFLPQTGAVVYSESNFANMTNPQISKLVSVDLASGNKTILFESQTNAENLSTFEISTNEIFLIANRQLWIYEESGRKAVIELNFDANDFTVSPSGRRLCFVENGDLFAIRLDLK